MNVFCQKIIVFFAPLVVVACASPQPPVKPTAQDVVAQLIDSEVATANAQRQIGFETEVLRPVYGNEITSVSFAGDALQLLENAARGMGKSFLVTGPQPRLPIFVQINVKAVTFENFLQQVARQLGQRADIELSDKLIELKYR